MENLNIFKEYINNTNRLHEIRDILLGINRAVTDKISHFVKEHGGLIRTQYYNPLRDEIWCYYINDEGEVKDTNILAIAVIYDDLVVLPEYGYNSREEFEKLSDIELIGLKGWLPIMGGDIITNVALYNICDILEEYIDTEK